MLDSSVDEYNLLVACVFLTYTMQVTTFPTELSYKHMCYTLSPVWVWGTSTLVTGGSVSFRRQTPQKTNLWDTAP